MVNRASKASETAGRPQRRGGSPLAGGRAFAAVLRTFPGSRELPEGPSLVRKLKTAQRPFRGFDFKGRCYESAEPIRAPYVRRVRGRKWTGPAKVGNAVLVMNENGATAELRVEGGKQMRVGGGTRVAVTEFTRRSRKRLMSYLRRVHWSVLVADRPKAQRGRAFFVTLTYKTAPNVGTSKRHLKAFLMAVRRRWPGVGGFWKLESQEDRAAREGAGFVAHYHLLLDCKSVQEWADVAAWVRARWEYGRTDTWTAYGGGGQLMAYLGKYLGKDTAGAGSEAGRYWGRLGRVPEAPRRTIVCDMAEALHAMADARPENEYVTARARSGCRRLVLDGQDLAARLAGYFDLPHRAGERARPGVGPETPEGLVNGVAGDVEDGRGRRDRDKSRSDGAQNTMTQEVEVFPFVDVNPGHDASIAAIRKKWE